MNREQKGQVTAAVVDRLENSEAVVAADFRGLTVAELADLRMKLREAEAEMTVVKNTLSRRAVNETGRLALLPYLEGPTGLVWINGDPARAAKALNDFAKEHEEVFSIRGGILGGEDLPTESILRLAKLPSREVLLAQLAGGIAAPLTGLAGTLNGLISTFARTLSAVQGSGQLAAGEPTATATTEAESVPAAEPESPPASESVNDVISPEATSADDNVPAAEEDGSSADAPAVEAVEAEVEALPEAEPASDENPESEETNE